MRLRGRLTLGFLIVAALPIVGGAWVAHREISARYEREFERTLSMEEARVKDEYRKLIVEVTKAGDRLARADSPVLATILPELATKGELDEELQRQLMARAPEEMRAHGLDALTLLDERGTVLACGHFVGHVGDVERERAFGTVIWQPTTRLVSEKVLDKGSPAARAELMVASVVPTQLRIAGVSVHMTVIVGRLLAPALLSRINVPARVVGFGQEAELVPGVRRVVPLGDLAGVGPISVEISVPADELAITQRWIRRGAAMLAAAATVLAFLLGTWIARRISSPIQALTEQTRALAEGLPTTPLAVRTLDEVGELASAFNKMTGDLDTARSELVRAERIAAWREIAQRIAHEIKNPLSPIQMAIETMQRVRRGETKGKVDFDALFDESTATILSEVARLRHIVAEFSRFARMPAPTLAALELNLLIEHVLGLYASLPYKIVRELSASAPSVNADENQLTQVLVNLLENARDAVGERGENGEIRVGTRVDAEAVYIVIGDNGQGMSAEIRERLFTPYFTTKPRGTGLGLAIVHRIVTDHGGAITVESEAGRGSSFSVKLPLK